MFILTWGNVAIWRSYFSDGLKPPTRNRQNLGFVLYVGIIWEMLYSFSNWAVELILRPKRKDQPKITSQIIIIALRILQHTLGMIWNYRTRHLTNSLCFRSSSFYLAGSERGMFSGYVWGSLRITLTVFPTCEPLIYLALVVSLKVKHQQRWHKPACYLYIVGVFFSREEQSETDKVVMIALVYTWSQEDLLFNFGMIQVLLHLQKPIRYRLWS